MELDHIYIKAKFGAPEADQLISFGLIEGEGNIHQGQGTSNRRFFFHNTMIEFLWVSNLEEVQNETTKPMKLYERLTGNLASPLGICFRPSEDNGDFEVDYWQYRPKYLPPHLSIDVFEEITIKDPLWFYIQFGSRPDSKAVYRDVIDHRIPLKEVTNLKVISSNTSSNQKLIEIINSSKNVTYLIGDEDLLIVEFDENTRLKEHDFRPDIPMVFKW